MGAVLERGIGVFQLGSRLAIGADGEVLHITGVMAVGIVEAVLLALGIEVAAGGFEIRAFTLRNLVKVEGVLSRREIMQVQLKGHAWSLIPDENAADLFSLGIFQFNLGFTEAGG